MAEQTKWVSPYLSVLVVLSSLLPSMPPPPPPPTDRHLSKLMDPPNAKHGLGHHGLPSTTWSDSTGPSTAESGSGSGSGSSTEGADAVGFEHEFVTPVEEKYECPICCFVLRNPNQTKCGHRFCASCIRKWISERSRPGQNAPCPICSTPLTHNDLFTDNFAKREILSLQIRCPHREEGCKTVMELRDATKHQLTCAHAVLPCPNGCLKRLKRGDIEDHLSSSCERRLIDCPVCHLQIVVDQKEVHLTKDCPMVDVICELCSAKIPRSQLQNHMDDSCPKVLMECAFKKVGCATKIERDQLDTHLHLSMQAHLKMVADTVESLWTYLQPPKMDPSFLSHMGRSGTSHDFPESLGQLTLPPLSRDISGSAQFQQSMTTTDSGLPSSTVQRFSTSSSGSFLTHPTKSSSEAMMSVASSSRLPQQLDSLSLNIPTGYSDPLPSRTNASLTRELEMHSDPHPPAGSPRGSLVRQSSLGVVEEQLNYKGQHVKADVNLGPIYKRLNEQEQRAALQTQQIVNLQNQNAALEQKVTEQSLGIQKLDEEFEEYKLRNSSGTFIWKIPNYCHKKSEAQRGTRTVIHSPGFYSSLYGYKLCVRLNINGVESATGTHISLFVHFMQGEYDDILEWPFSGRISLAILDQSDVTQYRQPITETLLSKPTLAAFQRPHTHRNHKGFGYVEFSPLGLIEGSNPRYLKNDAIFIKVKVDTN